MNATPTYSTLFSCLYDEAAPIGHLGRGTHYSIFRSVEWLDVVRLPLLKPEIHDFAVIWDEDHDRRIIRVVEQIYLAGLLSPIQFIGERKGCLTIIVAAKFFWGSEEECERYVKEIAQLIHQTLPDDPWTTEVGSFDRQPGSPTQTELKSLIATDEHRAITYVRNIDSLWSLGTKPSHLVCPGTETPWWSRSAFATDASG
jgi:hypothetical protein